ncbi:MAG TPA: nucleotidyltransferase [Cyclobacteriaceae bacterium]|nr:nucleotidyltransferase [Cyclobacteriaceae bacterium]
MIFEQDYIDFLRLLKKNGVTFLVIGGYALAVHERPRFTGDLDIWIEAEEINAQKVVNAINEFGFESLNVSAEDFLAEDYFVQMGYEPVRIDVTAKISGVTFQEAFPNRKEIEIQGMKIPFIGIEELIKNKLASGRDQDIVDVKKLQQIVKRKKK